MRKRPATNALIASEPPLELPEPRVVGRTTLVANVTRAAAFFVTHFAGVVLRQQASLPGFTASPHCAEVVHVKLPGHQQIITFVQDASKPVPAGAVHPVEQVLAQADSEMLKVDRLGVPSAWT
eukprot:805412-Prymnesium_polylepis.1